MDRRRLLNYTYVEPLEVKFVEIKGIRNAQEFGAYIDLQYEPKVTTKIQMKFTPHNTTGDIIIGVNMTDDWHDWRFFNYGTSYYYDFPTGNGENGTRICDGYMPLDEKYELELGNYYLKNLTTGENILTGETQTEFNTPIGSLCINRDSKANSSSWNTWNYIKIYEDDTLVKDFIPVKLLAKLPANKCSLNKVINKNTLGLWDKVNEMFYPSSTDDVFIEEE